MQLIGMLDSPYVRRVAISLHLLELPFEHQSLSVFRTFDEFRQINPVVKAPTLVCDEGEVLMDSTLILDYLAGLPGARRRLMPEGLAERRRTLRLIGLALAACEKSVQIVYERELRPAEKLHQPWISRVSGQVLAAYTALEAEITRQPLAATNESIDQAGLTTAVAWHFTQQLVPDVVDGASFPKLQAYSTIAETLPCFRAAPHGDGVAAPVTLS